MQSINVHLEFKDTDAILARMQQAASVASASPSSPRAQSPPASAWLLRAASARDTYASVRDLVTSLLPTVGDQLGAHGAAGFARAAPSPEMAVKLLTIYDKLLASMRKLFKGVSAVHAQVGFASLRVRLRPNVATAVPPTAPAASSAASAEPAVSDTKPAFSCIDVFALLPTAAQIRELQTAQANAAEVRELAMLRVESSYVVEFP